MIQWKQCAPTGIVSQRFSSLVEACEAFEQNLVVCSHDLYLHRMGKQMTRHRSLNNYRPTYMKLAEAKGAPVRLPPWINSSNSAGNSFHGPRCILSDPGKAARVGFKGIHHSHHPRSFMAQVH